MKFIAAIVTILCVLSCSNNTQNTTTNSNTQTDTLGNYFPVTSYIKGEIFNIKNSGITPIYKIKIGDKTDSLWIKMDSIHTILKEFLNPTIDTANVKSTHEESSFGDQTLATYTFTYSLRKNIADSFAFSNWDVLIDQETNKVKRLYLVKKIDPTTTAQLTWLSGKYCKMLYLKNTNGKTNIEKEETLTWSFD